MKKYCLLILLIFLLLAFAGCRKPVEHPEESDPVFRDLKTEANKAIGAYKEKEKMAATAKKTFEEAPIRTGQRLNAQEDYFAALNQQQKAAERYRYLALKVELRKKRDLAAYPHYFQDNLPWPDITEFEQYETEQRLANAPKEWNPDQRIHQRQMASEKKKAPAPEEHE